MIDVFNVRSFDSRTAGSQPISECPAAWVALSRRVL
jgi:hypothetical protein